MHRLKIVGSYLSPYVRKVLVCLEAPQGGPCLHRGPL